MRTMAEILTDRRIMVVQKTPDGGQAWVYRVTERKPMAVVFSNGMGWDHVSVSYANKTPSWDDMCYIKDLFFDPEECVVQFHPPKSEYVNCHPHCLHLWKQQSSNFETPNKIMV